MRYRRLQKHLARALLSKLLKKSFFFRREKSCYNKLQWVAMRYKMLQKQLYQRTNVKVVEMTFFSKGSDKLLRELLWACRKTLREYQRNNFVVM